MNQRLDRELSELDRYRIRVTASRVKSPARTWAKLTKDKYAAKVTGLDSIAALIDDLVGVRVTCHNLVDVTYLRSILSDLPPHEEEAHSAFGMEPESERQYFERPKPSGYRAYHLNLVTAVAQPDSQLVPVRGELQVRTLLQDSWGELTHEDTYKPGVELPPLAVTLARRMADILAAVDDLAQDLRQELDRLANASVGIETATPTDLITPPPDHHHLGGTEHKPALNDADVTSPARVALLDETRRVVRSLSRPASLASIAQQIQSSFGTAIVPGWGGYQSFKGLLIAAVPDVRIVGSAPGMVFPPGSALQVDDSTNLVKSGVHADVPDVIQRLRAHDKSLPVLGGADLDRLMLDLEAALSEEAWRYLTLQPDSFGIRDLSRLTKYVRDQAVQSGREHASRHHIDYLLKALLWSGNLRAGLNLTDAKRILADWLFRRVESVGLVVEDSDATRASIFTWLDV